MKACMDGVSKRHQLASLAYAQIGSCLPAVNDDKFCKALTGFVLIGMLWLILCDSKSHHTVCIAVQLARNILWLLSLQVHTSFEYAGCTKDQMVSAAAKDTATKWQAPSLPSAVTVPVTSAITSVTAHPDTDEIVAGTEAGMLLLLANK